MLWIKSFHIIFMVIWFSGLLYLPRLFVYHSSSEDKISQDRFKIMERKLYYGIATPGALLTIIFGVWMLMEYAARAYAHMMWLHLKMGLVLLLIIYHIYCARLIYLFKHDRNPYSHVFYRWFNEFPVLILIAVVLLSILKPF